MAQVFVSIGSNIEPSQYICTALDALQQAFGNLLISKVYRSIAVGFEGEDFLNLVVGFDYQGEVIELRKHLRQIETACGRQRNGAKYSARTLDLDILTYGDQIICSDGIDLPSDEITRYAFVLLPLTDIAADQLHPSLQQSYRALWQNFDQSEQRLTPIDFVWQDQVISTSQNKPT